MGLEKIGHELVVKNAEQFNRKMRDAQKSVDDFQRTVEKGAKSKRMDLVPKGTESRLDKLKAMVRGFTGELQRMPGPIGAASRGLAGLTDLVSMSTGKWIALTAAVVAASAVLLKLGARGAVMEGVITAFYAITEGAGLASRALLNELSVAAAGTVRDLELMRLTNLALAGATSTLGKELGSKLPKLMEIARAQARATGYSVSYLFDSLVKGVKRAQPLLIDNTGLIIKIGEANRAMAAELGKSVEQLTTEEKALAVLNATLEAGQRALDQYGSKTKTAADYAAGLGVRLQNMLDRLGIGLLPLYTLVLQVADALLEGLIWPIQNLLIPVLYELNKAIFGPASEAFMILKQLITTAFAPLANWLRSWVTPIVASLRLLGMVFSWLVRTAGKALAGIVMQIHKFSSEFFKGLSPQKFFEGGARIIGELAKGMLWAANTILLPAVIEIATLIADFLVGLSPPKKGPLSMIDKGGENVMLAWLEGFTGIGIDPVEDVVAEVNEALGAIGKLSLKQVEKALERLDAAIQPFIDRLSIVKARMEAILAPLNQIKSVIERKLDRELKGFFAGEISEEQVRALDRQAEAVDEQIAGVQDMTDEAEYQLLLMQLQQAEARALLEIQQRRLQGTEEEADALDAVAEKLKETAKKGAGDLEDTLTEAGAGFAPLSDIDPLADFLGIDEEAVAESMEGVKGAFMEGFGAEGLAALDEFRSKTGDLSKQLERIKGSSGAQKISELFNTITEKSGEMLENFSGFVDEFTEQWDKFTGLFDDVDPDLLESIGLALVALTAPSIIAGLLGISVTGAGAAASLVLLGASTLVSGIEAVTGALLGLTAAALPLALLTLVIYAAKTNFGGFGDSLQQVWDGIKEKDWKKAADGILDSFTAIPKGLAEAALDFLGVDQDMQDALDTWPGIFENLKTIIETLPGFINEKLGGVPGDVWDALVQPFIDAVKGIMNLIFGGGGRDVDASLKAILEGLVIGVALWLFGLPAALLLVLYKVFEDEINNVINKIFDFDNPDSLGSKLKSLPNSIKEWLSDLPNKLKKYFLEPFKSVINEILGLLGEIGQAIQDLLSTDTSGGGAEGDYYGDRPPEDTYPVGQHGGDIKPNETWVVGDKGWEFFRPRVGGRLYSHAQSVAMLHQMRQAMSMPRSMMRLMSGPQAQDHYLPASGGSTYNTTSTDNRRQTNTFNVRGSQSLRLALAQAKAWK